MYMITGLDTWYFTRLCETLYVQRTIKNGGLWLPPVAEHPRGSHVRVGVQVGLVHLMRVQEHWS